MYSSCSYGAAVYLHVVRPADQAAWQPGNCTDHHMPRWYPRLPSTCLAAYVPKGYVPTLCVCTYVPIYSFPHYTLQRLSHPRIKKKITEKIDRKELIEKK